MSIIRIGSTSKYAEGWSAVFGGRSAKKATPQPAGKKTKGATKAARKPATKKAKKKVAKKRT